jgi:hypothetical protein
VIDAGSETLWETILWVCLLYLVLGGLTALVAAFMNYKDTRR